MDCLRCTIIGHIHHFSFSKAEKMAGGHCILNIYNAIRMMDYYKSCTPFVHKPVQECTQKSLFSSAFASALT